MPQARQIHGSKGTTTEGEREAAVPASGKHPPAYYPSVTEEEEEEFDCT
jgi:hypothetical protein